MRKNRDMCDFDKALLTEIEALVDHKIAEHERKVGWVSGVIGIAFIAGIIHSIWLVKQLAIHTSHT